MILPSHTHKKNVTCVYWNSLDTVWMRNVSANLWLGYISRMEDKSSFHRVYYRVPQTKKPSSPICLQSCPNIIVSYKIMIQAVVGHREHTYYRRSDLEDNAIIKPEDLTYEDQQKLQRM